MKRDSRLSGSMAGLVALVLLVAAASPAVQAQQRNIPIPASSASPGGVAAASAATIEDVRQTQSLIQNQVGGGFACGMVRYQAVAYAVGGIGYGYGQSGVQSAVACNGVSPAYSVITSPENRHYQTIALNCPSGYARMVSSVDWIPDTNADQGQYTRWFITQVCTKT